MVWCMVVFIYGCGCLNKIRSISFEIIHEKFVRFFKLSRKHLIVKRFLTTKYFHDLKWTQQCSL